jgi:DNA mismatch endonuclease (patch repair protein)
MPKTNVKFWNTKIKKNKERDLRRYRYLMEKGWKIIEIWECTLKKMDDDQILEFLSTHIQNNENDINRKKNISI